MMREGKPAIGRLYLGISKPKRAILGSDFAGEVVAMGQAATQFQVGDNVFGGTATPGCYAEYVCVSVADVIATMPTNISYQEAAPVSSSAITVMTFLLGLGNLKPTDNVLINGASGSVGSYAVQIAKRMGATVTGVCSTANVAMVQSLGADHVMDYTKEDFTQQSPTAPAPRSLPTTRGVDALARIVGRGAHRRAARGFSRWQAAGSRQRWTAGCPYVSPPRAQQGTGDAAPKRCHPFLRPTFRRPSPSQ